MDVLEISECANESGNLLTYQRSGEEHKLVVCYNQGEESLSLSQLFKTYRLREWFLWTGELGAVRNDQLLANECRVFELLEKGTTEGFDENANQRLSLKNQPWTLTVESWEIAAPESLETKKNTKQRQLLELSYWNELSDFEHLSGVGIYRTDFRLEDKTPKKFVLKMRKAA